MDIHSDFAGSFSFEACMTALERYKTEIEAAEMDGNFQRRQGAKYQVACVLLRMASLYSAEQPEFTQDVIQFLGKMKKFVRLKGSAFNYWKSGCWKCKQEVNSLYYETCGRCSKLVCDCGACHCPECGYPGPAEPRF
jgi:hypothetical protein